MQSWKPALERCCAHSTRSCSSRCPQSVFDLASDTRQASQIPSVSKCIVFLALCALCAYSTAELGRWFEMVHLRQNFTCRGSPYFACIEYPFCFVEIGE